MTNKQTNKFTRSAWFVDSLGANLLLGNESLDSYKGHLNCEHKTASQFIHDP